MNRLSLALLAGVAVFGALPAAQAADLLINRPSTPGFVDVGGGGGGWDGVYVGAFGGFAWNSFDAAGAPEPIDGSGWLLGVTAGANFTVTPGLVAGIAGDIAWNDVNGEESGVVSSMDWTGSLRGRLGWDADAILPYVTGGLAFAGGTLAGTGAGCYGDPYRLDGRRGRRDGGRRAALGGPAVPLFRLRHRAVHR